MNLDSVLIGFVALEHLAFMILEMFYWSKPVGRKIFRQTEENALITKNLAANQGLYNGFLCVGLVWALIELDPGLAHSLKVFFLSCVLVAGIYGAYSVNKRIFFVQALPAAIALLLLLTN